MTDSTGGALRTAILYGILSVVWLLAFDGLLPSFIEDPAHLTIVQRVGGYAWVLMSAVMLFLARDRLMKSLVGQAQTGQRTAPCHRTTASSARAGSEPGHR